MSILKRKGRIADTLGIPGSSKKPSLSQRLRENTVEGLRQNASMRNMEDNSFERIWNDPVCQSSEMLSKLDECMEKSASYGNRRLAISFTNHLEIESTSGLRVYEDDLSEGKVHISIWNFEIYRNGMQESVVKTKEQILEFEKYISEKTCQHAISQGLSAEYKSIYGSLYIFISWMSQDEHNQMQQLIEIPGGYDAYSKGVPIEDIIV